MCCDDYVISFAVFGACHMYGSEQILLEEILTKKKITVALVEFGSSFLWFESIFALGPTNYLKNNQGVGLSPPPSNVILIISAHQVIKSK